MQVNKDDIVSIKGNLYQYIKDNELCDLVCPTCHSKYDSSYYQKYSLIQIKNELIRAHKLNKHIRFYIQLAPKKASIFVNKAINAGFDCTFANIIGKTAPRYILERNEHNGRYICSAITAMDVRNLPTFYLYELDEDNISDLDVNYITFNRFFDGRYAFEVTNIYIQCLPQSNLGTACFVKQPENKNANITIRLSGNTDLDEKLKEYLYGDDRYSADAQIHLSGDPDLLSHYRLNFLSSIEHGFGLDDECLILEYLHVDSVDDRNIAYRRDLIYGDFYLPHKDEICSVPTINYESEIQKLEMEQKLKEYGFDELDLKKIMQGIDYQPSDSLIDKIASSTQIGRYRDFVTFDKAEVEFMHNMYNKEKEKEKEEKMIKLTKDGKSREITQIVINEEEGIVTTVGNKLGLLPVVIKKDKNGKEYNENDPKVVAMAKTAEGDEFDKYTGAALALAYQLFGSKTQFRKYVDNEAKYIKQIKEKKEKAKAKKKQVKKDK